MKKGKAMNGGEILKKLPEIMLAIKEIPKAKRNDGQNYNFRGIDDALNHCGPILASHGVSLSIEVREHHVDREIVSLNNSKERVEVYARVLLAVTFRAGDGSEVVNVAAGEGVDYGSDKATSKAMSAAFKYCLFLGLAIPVEADTLPDSDHDAKQEERNKRQGTRTASSNGAGPKQGSPVKPETATAEPESKKTEPESKKTEPRGKAPADKNKTAFWKYASGLGLDKDAAAEIWGRLGNASKDNRDPLGRAMLEAYGLANGVEPEAIQAVWSDKKAFDPAVESLAATLAAFT